MRMEGCCYFALFHILWPSFSISLLFWSFCKKLNYIPFHSQPSYRFVMTANRRGRTLRGQFRKCVVKLGVILSLHYMFIAKKRISRGRDKECTREWAPAVGVQTMGRETAGCHNSTILMVPRRSTKGTAAVRLPPAFLTRSFPAVSARSVRRCGPG